MTQVDHPIEQGESFADGEEDSLQDMAVQLFELFDREQKGYVLADDIDDTLGDEMGLSYTQLHDIFAILDQDNTGKITVADFTTAFVQQAFSEMSSNNDDENTTATQGQDHPELEGYTLGGAAQLNEDTSDELAARLLPASPQQSDTCDRNSDATPITIIGNGLFPRFILDSVDYEDEGTAESCGVEHSRTFERLWTTLSEEEEDELDNGRNLLCRSPPDGVETHACSQHSEPLADTTYRPLSIHTKNNSFGLSERQESVECSTLTSSPVKQSCDEHAGVPSAPQSSFWASSLESVRADVSETSALSSSDDQAGHLPSLNLQPTRSHVCAPAATDERGVRSRHSRARDLRRFHSTPHSRRRPKHRLTRGSTLSSSSPFSMGSHNNCTSPYSIGQVNSSNMLPSSAVNNNIWNSVNGEVVYHECEGGEHNSQSLHEECNDSGRDHDHLDAEEETEDWNSVLTRLQCASLFAGNRNLRFVWQQISAYQPDLLHTFEDFLKSTVDEIQATYVKYQELEITLNSKTEQYDRELASIYDEMEHMLTREKEILQTKFSEREERSRVDSNRMLERKETERNEILRQKSELEERLHGVVEDLTESKASEERLSNQLNNLFGTEYNLRHENDFLRQENSELQERLRDSKRTMIDIQDQCTSVRSILDTDKENYRRCLRRFQDVLEEKEFLDMNISNMSSELTELRSLNKSLQERMDGGLNTSMLWSEEHESPIQSPGVLSSSDDFQHEVVPYAQEMSLKEELLTDFNLLGHCQSANVFKVVFVGDANVGKSSIIRKICRGTFQEHRQSTTVPDYTTKSVAVGDRSVGLQLWDTVGQERFNSLPPAYFRKSDVVVLMYDIEDELSFINAKDWIKMIYDYTNEDVLLVLVGNKLDVDHRRQVKVDRAEKLSKEHDAIFVETSAKTGENVAKFCQLIASTMLEKEDTLLIREASVDLLDFRLPKKKKNDKCCSG